MVMCRLCIVLFTVSGVAQAADQPNSPQLGNVTVFGQKTVDTSAPVGVDTSTPATVYQIGREGVSLFGGAGSTNPYSVIDRLPSVNAQSADAYGMANIPGGNKGLRTRGELSTHGGGGSVDGLPLTGINPGPGNQWLFDLENIASVSLGQGPIAPDRLAFFTTSGVLDSEILWPQAERGLQVAQSLGSDAFKRSFARLDSGQFAEGSALFLSGSHTEADKWRGPGLAPSGRTNVAGALSHPLGSSGFARLLVTYNDVEADNYRPLTYAQATDLDTWRDFDFSSSSTAVPATAISYFGYNRQQFESLTTIGELGYTLGDSSQILVKPYYLKEKGEYFDGMANGKVRNWLIDHAWYGFTAEWQKHFANTGVKLGYWGESSEPPGPPTAWKLYNPTASGGLTGASWSILGSTTTRHRFDSLYALADQSFGAFKAQAGVRYVRETLPGIDFHNTAGIGDVSYARALALSSGVVANRSAKSFVIDEFLPFVAFDYALNPAATIKASLGRNYGAPSFDVWPVFQQNSAALLAKGLTADALWHTLRAETANAIDLGLNLRSAQAYFDPTIFYSRNHNKSVSYDPGVGVAYSQNVGETHAYGAQMIAGWSPRSTVDLFGGASYNRNVFSEDLPLLNGGRLAVTGKQLPDAPHWQANAGGTWRLADFSLTPLLRYTGTRHGDTQNLQKISGYFTVDLAAGYQQQLGIGRIHASLAVQNLFDRKYVGFINASYYQLLSNSSAYYYPGAPRTLIGRLALDL
jgi:iron complex outermembrane receptor protein